MGRSGFWIRAAATAIDAVVFLVFAFTVFAARAVLDARGTLTPTTERGMNAMLIVLWLAYSSMEAMIGATAGKLAVGIVITLPDGAPAPAWTRVLRWSTKQIGWLLVVVHLLSDNVLAYYLGGTLNGLVGIGCLRALGEEKRTWHDIWSHTAVVSRKLAAQMRDVHEEPVGPPTPT